MQCIINSLRALLPWFLGLVLASLLAGFAAVAIACAIVTAITAELAFFACFGAAAIGILAGVLGTSVILAAGILLGIMAACGLTVAADNTGGGNIVAPTGNRSLPFSRETMIGISSAMISISTAVSVAQHPLHPFVAALIIIGCATPFIAYSVRYFSRDEEETR